MTKHFGILGAVAIFVLGIAACGPADPSSGANGATVRAATLWAILTESSHNQSNPSPTAVVNTLAPEIPSISPTLAATAIPVPTELPSVTPRPTELPIPCYRAEFVTDVTIPDYYDKLTPDETFVKTWRLKNTGSCSWAANTEVVFISGSQMGGPSEQEIGQVVGVGDQIDLSVTLKAPTQSGTFTGYWILQTPVGGRFGTGNAGDQPLWVLIVLHGSTATPIATNTAGTPTITKTPTNTPSPTPLPTSTGTRTPTLTPTCAGGYPVC